MMVMTCSGGDVMCCVVMVMTCSGGDMLCCDGDDV